MSSHAIGLLLGGLLAAVLYGFTGVFAKASTQAGIGLGPYMFIAGISIAAVGVVAFLINPDKTLSMQSGLHAAGLGISWGIGTALVAIALSKYKVPLGQIVPLYNMNTLVAVLLALWIFAEWKEVHTMRLLLGSVLIVIGGTLVAKS
jgi:drug/metabolite transporter (DMT)-like permease